MIEYSILRAVLDPVARRGLIDKTSVFWKMTFKNTSQITYVDQNIVPNDYFLKQIVKNTS